jgi:adhesin/invasin
LIVLLLTTTSACFVRGSVDSTLSLSTFQALPATLVADGKTSAQLSVVLINSEGERVPGAAVLFASDSNGAAFTQPAATDASGATMGSVTSTTVGVQTINAWAVGDSQKAAVPTTVQVTFIPGGASATTSAFRAAPATVLANGQATTTVALSIRDAYNHPLPAQSVSLSSTGTGNVFAAA